MERLLCCLAIAQAAPTCAFPGSELFSQGLAFAAERLPGAELMQMDARSIPYVAEFDAIGAFDVLEHIVEDEMVLRETNKALKQAAVCCSPCRSISSYGAPPMRVPVMCAGIVRVI